MILFIFEIDFNKMARWNLDTILEIDWTKIRKKLLKKNTFSFNVFVLNTLSVRKVSTHLEDHEKSAWYNIAAIRWQHHYTCVNFRFDVTYLVLSEKIVSKYEVAIVWPRRKFSKGSNSKYAHVNDLNIDQHLRTKW